MRGDAEQPGRKLRGRLIGASRAVHAQEDLLGQFLRHRLVLHHPVEEVDHRGAVLLQQDGEARPVAFLDPEHQLGVVVQGCRKAPHI